MLFILSCSFLKRSLNSILFVINMHMCHKSSVLLNAPLGRLCTVAASFFHWNASIHKTSWIKSLQKAFEFNPRRYLLLITTERYSWSSNIITYFVHNQKHLLPNEIPIHTFISYFHWNEGFLHRNNWNEIPFIRNIYQYYYYFRWTPTPETLHGFLYIVLIQSNKPKMLN